MHYEIVSALATQPNTGLAGTALTGDSLTIKNGKGKICILASWASRQVAGFSQLIFPSGHDTTRNYRAGCGIGKANFTLPLGMQIDVEAQELLAPTLAGSNVAADIELDSHLLYYADFPGISMRTLSPAQVESRLDRLTTIESSVASVATGQYFTEAITADSDLLKANRDYAIIGCATRTAVHAVVIQAPDFGNVRVGCPGFLRPEITSQWFMMLSRLHGLPLVPVFNTGNKGQVTLGACDDENAVATLTTLYLALLK
jgi:hypothetical protein